MSRRPRPPKSPPSLPAPSADERPSWPIELAKALARLVAGRALFVIGAALSGLGGSLLASAYRLGPEVWLERSGRAALTARAEVQAVRPFWRVEAEPTPLGAFNWPLNARAELCAELAPVGAAPLPPLVACGARRSGYPPWGLVETQEIAPGAPVVWPRDERGWPLVEARIAAATLAKVRALPPSHWPLLGQSEEARQAMPPPGSAWDAFWLEVDRPLEWLVRAAAAPAEARFEVAYDPASPRRALPVALLDPQATAGSGSLFFLVLFAALGGLAWAKGIRIAFLGFKPPWAIWIFGLAPLLLMPWWGDRFADAVRRLAPGLGEIGLALAADLGEAGRPPVEIHERDFGARLERVVWRPESSYYREPLAAFDVHPLSHPGDADGALRAATDEIGARLLASEPAAQIGWLRTLAWEEQLDRGEVSLLWAPAALELLKDSSQPPAVRSAAENFLFWHGVTPLGIGPDQPAFAARRAIWEALSTAPDAAVANLATYQLERLEKP